MVGVIEQNTAAQHAPSPQLRFKDENGRDFAPLEKKQLKDIASKILKKNKGSEITNVITNSAKQGLISQRSYFSKDIANQLNIGGYYVISEGDFVYNPRISNESPYGPVHVYALPDDGIVSPLYLCFRTNGVNVEYLKHFFISASWYRHTHSHGDSGARSDRFNIKDVNFFKMPISLPSPREQQKIANFLSALDTRIDAQSDKVAALTEQKKALMQKIFAQELRFTNENGASYAPWEEKMLVDEADIYQPQTISQKDLTDSGYKVYGANGVIGHYSKYNHEFEQIAITCRGNTCGTLNFTEKYSWITGNAMVINVDARPGVDKKYLYFFLNGMDFNSIITGSGQPQITRTSMKNLKINLPSLPEQQKIATFLSKLDQRIELEQDKLDAYRDEKKAFMQRMFV